MGLSLIMVVVLNGAISAVTMLSDARIMMPAYIIYGIGMAIFASFAQKNIAILFKKYLSKLNF